MKEEDDKVEIKQTNLDLLIEDSEDSQDEGSEIVEEWAKKPKELKTKLERSLSVHFHKLTDNDKKLKGDIDTLEVEANIRLPWSA